MTLENGVSKQAPSYIKAPVARSVAVKRPPDHQAFSWWWMTLKEDIFYTQGDAEPVLVNMNIHMCLYRGGSKAVEF